ncbi:MAG: beta strand repeat-containing protein, partial [Bacteroidota bacterium]
GAGGTAPYSGTGTFSNLSAGSYSYTITDANGCTSVVSATVTQPTLLTAASTSGAIACFGGNTSVNVTGGGGTAPYSGTGSFTVGAGSYSYTVTDANGCTVVTNIAVSDPTLLTSTANPSPALCNGAATGSIVVNGAGGTAPYSGTGTFSNLAAGTYSYTVTDANGCTSVVSATVTQPTLLTAASTSGAITCFGGTTSVSVTGGGGTAPYAGTGSFTVGAGSYSYTVTDANGCTVVTNITVSEPTLLTSTATPSPALCNGATTGSVIVSGAGGTAPYSGTGTFSNLAAGAYSYTVTDANGCTSVVSATVTQPTLLTAASASGAIACFGGTTSVSVTGGGGTAPYAGTGSFTVGAGSYSYTVTDANGCTVVTNITLTQPTQLSASSVTNPASCGNSNGSASISASGGTPVYNYSINGGAVQISSSFPNLLAGNYTVVVTDANGCTSSVAASVSNTSAPIINAVTQTNNSCFNSNNGTISINANGGTGSLQYSINNGATNQAGSNFSNLAAGTYSIVVTDNLGCQATSSITITEPPILSATNNAGTIACNGGNTSISVTGSGGTLPYVGTGTFTVSAGTYSYTVTDANGCTATTSAIITQPTLLTTTSNPTSVSCFGGSNGSVSIVANGGTIPYSGNGVITSLIAGTYSNTVTDANGCTSVATTTVTQPSQLTASTTSTPSSCGNNNGTTSIIASGGIPSYSYSINNGATSQSIGNFSNLLAGTYSILITDANGCTLVVNSAVNNTSSPIVNSISPTNNTCFNSNNGTLAITASGGTGALQYSITGGSPFQPSGNFNNLAAGTYSIVVVDALGCQTTSTATITEPALLTSSNNASTIACFGGTATISVSASGGT